MASLSSEFAEPGQEVNQITLFLLVSVGGASGALSRWFMATFINTHWQSSFPWATLCINLLGSTAFGVVYAWSMAHEHWRDPIRMLFLMGFMGAFTTFSTFSFETVKLIEGGKLMLALCNIFGSVILCVMGTWAGLAAGKHIFN